MRLRAGLPVLRRGPTSVQVGTDRRWAARVDDLSEAEADALVRLGPTMDLANLAEHVAGADLSRLTTVGAALAEAGLAVAAQARRLPGAVAAEQAVAALLGRPDPTVARADRCVGIVGLGPIGLGVATALATSGVGTVLLDDPRPVRSVEVGARGYRWEDVGSPREDVAARVVRDVAPTVALSGAAPDLLVLVAHGAVDPEQAPALVAAGIPHLPVVVHEGEVVVGPLVVPGGGPCLRCLDLHRTDLDPDWPLLAHQLATRGGAADEPGAGEVPAVAAVCAGLAAAAVLTHLDGGASPLRGATVEVSVPHALPRRRAWAAHPSCGCTALLDRA